jgi:hypothetical protein
MFSVTPTFDSLVAITSFTYRHVRSISYPQSIMIAKSGFGKTPLHISMAIAVESTPPPQAHTVLHSRFAIAATRFLAMNVFEQVLQQNLFSRRVVKNSFSHSSHILIIRNPPNHQCTSMSFPIVAFAAQRAKVSAVKSFAALR